MYIQAHNNTPISNNDPSLTPSIHIESALNLLHTLLIDEPLSTNTEISLNDIINELETSLSKLEG